MTFLGRNINKYLELTKPKVTLLNLFVGLTCFVLASFPNINLLTIALFSLAGYLAAGGSGALNSAYDRNIDRMMPRTSKRAIPSGLITPAKAMIFGFVLTATGVGISFLFLNVLTAIMMALGAMSYLIVYTVWLKRISKWNVVVGGLAGCFAALSGWTAVTNSLSLLPLLIAAMDFLWTPGHLWGLAIKKVKEYTKAGIPMLPVSVGLPTAAKATFLFNTGAVASTLVLPLLGLAGLWFLIVAAAAGVWFLLESRRLMIFPSEPLGFRIFLASMPYLATIMTALFIDKFICAFAL